MAVFQDPTAVAVSGGTGISGYSVTGTESVGGGGGPGTATALLLAAPSEGEWGEPSEEFVVTPNGNVSGTLTVTPAAMLGGLSAGTFNPTSQAITGGTSAEFIFTPNVIGSITVSFTNDGGLANPASVTYLSVTPAPDPIDLSDKWLIDINPERDFETSQGTIPAGVTAAAATSTSGAIDSKVGQDNRPRASIELKNGSGIQNVNLWQNFSYVDADAIQYGASGHTTYEVLRIVADPDDAGQKAYHVRLNKDAVGSGGSKCRCELTVTGTDTRFEEWGTEEWMVFGFRFPSYWRSVSGGPFCLIAQFHDSPGGLTGGAMIDVEFVGGSGNASACKLQSTVKLYNNPDWPVNQDSKVKDNYDQAVADNERNLAADTWHWVVLHYRSGNGHLDYPNYVNSGNWGAPDDTVYGPRDPDDVFVEMYHAVGDALPTVAWRYDGFWGSPHAPGDPEAEKRRVGYWKTGIYTSTSFDQNDDRHMYFKGLRVYRASNAPGMTVFDVLRDFRGV